MGSPCEVEAGTWRECLKVFEYGPDRPKSACNDQRVRYYRCINAWRAKEQGPPILSPIAASGFQIPPKCAGKAEKLHHCMMMSMFEAEKCVDASLQLKICVAAVDPFVRSALDDDERVAASLEKWNETKEPAGLTRWWYKVIGKL